MNKIKRSAEVNSLIELYDNFQFAEFMNNSYKCMDVNIQAMRYICVMNNRFGTILNRSNVSKYDIKKLTKLADAGDPVAQTNLGFMYRSGYEVAIDLAKAKQLFQDAANQGYARGQYNLGRLYQEENTPKADRLAKKWIKASAVQGLSMGMYIYGRILLDSPGETIQGSNLKKACYWEIRALKKGIILALLELLRIAKIVGASSCINECWRTAWECGLDYRKVLYEDKYSFGTRYDAERLSQYSLGRLSLKMLKYRAKRNLLARTYLAYCIYEGRLGLEKDITLAKKMFEKLAEKGVTTAECLLGICYYKGYGCKQDYRKAFKLFSRAAKKNELDSLGWLGLMYYYGRGCRANIKKSVENNLKAAKIGNEGARYNIACTCLQMYDGLEYNPEKAIDLLWPLACTGRVSAIARLAECYIKGIGIKQNWELGIALLNTAVLNGAVSEMSYLCKGRPATVIKDFLEAIKSHKDDIEPCILELLEEYEKTYAPRIRISKPRSQAEAIRLMEEVNDMSSHRPDETYSQHRYRFDKDVSPRLRAADVL